MKLSIIKPLNRLALLGGILATAGCGSMFLSALNEVSKDQYQQEFMNTSDQLITQMKTLSTLETNKEGIVLQAVALRVAHQNKLPNRSGNTIAEHESSWGAGDGSNYGFRGASNVARDLIVKHLNEVRGFKSVYTYNDDGMKQTTEDANQLNFPIDLPKEDLNKQWEHMRKTTVTSYNRPTVDFKRAATVSNTGYSPYVFPYFTLSLKKTGAGLTKLNGELIINYIAKIKGSVIVCISARCETAETGTVNFTMPLIIHEHFTDEDVYRELDSHFQNQLGAIMSRYSVAAIDKILIKK